MPLEGRVSETVSRVGGGTMPRAELLSAALELRPTNGMTLAGFAVRLRRGTPPVVGYISGDRYRLDLRTVFPAQDAMIVRTIRQAFDGTEDL